MIHTAHSEYIGVYFDPANILQRIDARKGHYSTPLPEDWLREVGPLVKAVHMKDYALGIGFVDLLDGDVNWGKIRHLLSDIGYDGWLIAEIEVEPVDHLGAIAHLGKALDKFINM